MVKDYARITCDQWHTLLERNIEVEFARGILLALRYLEWDSQFFGLPCYELDWVASTYSQEAVNKQQLYKRTENLPKIAVWAKLTCTVPQSFVSVYKLIGAEYIETELNLRHDVKYRKKEQIPKIEAYKTDCTDIAGFLELGKVFSQTRFHVDPMISLQKADELWQRYLKNYIPAQDRHVFIAKEKEYVIGTILVSIKRWQGEIKNIIDIVAINDKARSRGIGSYLIQKALSWCIESGRPTVVSTQHRNVKAINFYIKNGFNIFESPRTVFHWWT